MQSLPQAPATRERLNELVAELFGDQPTPAPQAPASLSTADQRWQHAVTQVEEQLCAKLRVEVLPERMRKALELVGANAVTLQADGSASVQSGKQSYTLAPDCPCADAKHRAELCKHALAVELHRRALALFHGTAAESAPTAALAPTPATPSATPAVAAAAPPPAAAPSAPASHAWDVHEAPASACFKFRVGTMELLYTLRGVDDDELQRRITATLPTLQDIIEACEERAAQRAAARDAAQAQPVPQTPPAAVRQADLQTLIQQAVQQALAAPVNGAAQGTPPPAAPSTGTAPAEPAEDDQETGFCSLHQVAMQAHEDPETGDTWHSHWLEEERRYCRGHRPSRHGRRNGRR